MSALAIRGARPVLHGDGGPRVGAPMDVVVEGGRIVSLGAAAPGVPGLDAYGLVLMPGLIDLHTHFATPRDMELFLRCGVTSVRFAGTALGVVGALRDRVRRGEIAGPRIFSCGPHLDEAPTAWPEFTVVVQGPDDARSAAARLLDVEADALIAIQRIRPETLRAIAETAHGRGAPVTGQTWRTSVREAVLAGMDGVENTARLPEDPRRDATWLEGYRSIGDRLARLVVLWATAPRDAIEEVALLMAERGVVWTPALCSFAYWAGLTDAPIAEHALWQELAPEEREMVLTWRSRVTEGWGAEEGARVPAAIARMQEAIAAFREAGGILAIGTDVHPGGLFYPLEARYLASAGLSPADVFDAATSGGARGVRRDADLGRVAPGYAADLVAVEGDPLRGLDGVRVRHVLVAGAQLVRDGAVIAPSGRDG